MFELIITMITISLIILAGMLAVAAIMTLIMGLGYLIMGIFGIAYIPFLISKKVADPKDSDFNKTDRIVIGGALGIILLVLLYAVLI